MTLLILNNWPLNTTPIFLKLVYIIDSCFEIVLCVCHIATLILLDTDGLFFGRFAHPWTKIETQLPLLFIRLTQLCQLFSSSQKSTSFFFSDPPPPPPPHTHTQQPPQIVASIALFCKTIVQGCMCDIYLFYRDLPLSNFGIFISIP